MASTCVINSISKLFVNYDAERDRLYLNTAIGVYSVRTSLDFNFISWRYNKQAVLTGCTVPKYNEIWCQKISVLANVLSTRFCIDEELCVKMLQADHQMKPTEWRVK
jgi:hypothetical protein